MEKQVDIGDPVAVRYGKALYHGNKKVGFLSKKVADTIPADGAAPNFRVANVIRYTCGAYFEEHNTFFWGKLHPLMKERKWFYTLLVETY